MRARASAQSTMCDNPSNVGAVAAPSAPRSRSRRPRPRPHTVQRTRQGPVRAVRRRHVSDARRLALSGLRLQDGLLRLVMNIIDTHVNPADSAFRINRERMQQLVADLRERVSHAHQGGGPKYLERHREQGKLPVRDRIERLLDAGSPFLELSPLAALDMYDNEAPSAGIVTGIGRVSGRGVLLVANDATVKGATSTPVTDKKH